VQPSHPPTRSTSLPALIGWLSACLLAAAVGKALDDRWQTIWMQMGAFGLVAAVGLGALEKARASRAQSSRDRLVQSRLERGLIRFNQHSATLDSINQAVSRLAKHAASQPRKEVSAGRHSQRELLAGFPLEVVPVEDQAGALGLDYVRLIQGSLRQVSSRAISFEHCEPFGTPMVLLNFRLGAKQLSFGVDVLWTKQIDRQFLSGGTVLVVGVPATGERELASASFQDE
jgi:hypothetical protein